jgi:hypothetical protein
LPASSRKRKARGEEPLTFGMTFPFSTHNYHLRFWMAAGGVDPDEDVRLVVLPPPYMVDSLANGHVDGFCVGAPWNSVAVDSASASSCISCRRSCARGREGARGARPLGAGAPRRLAAARARPWPRRRLHRGRSQPRRGGGHARRADRIGVAPR